MNIEWRRFFIPKRESVYRTARATMTSSSESATVPLSLAAIAVALKAVVNACGFHLPSLSFCIFSTSLPTSNDSNRQFLRQYLLLFLINRKLSSMILIRCSTWVLMGLIVTLGGRFYFFHLLTQFAWWVEWDVGIKKVGFLRDWVHSWYWVCQDRMLGITDTGMSLGCRMLLLRGRWTRQKWTFTWIGVRIKRCLC